MTRWKEDDPGYEGLPRRRRSISVGEWIGIASDALAALAAAYVIVATHWSPVSSFWGYIAAGTVALVVPIVRRGRRIWLRHHRRAAGEALKPIGHQLRALVRAVAGEAAVDDLKIGAALWQVAGRNRLTRVEKLWRLDGPPEAAVDWRVAKGVVGRTAATGERQIFDAGAFDDRWDRDGKDAWCQASAAERLHLTWGDFLRLRHRYGSILTVAIVTNGKIAVLAVNGPPGSHAAMSSDSVVAIVESHAQYLQRVLELSRPS